MIEELVINGFGLATGFILNEEACINLLPIRSGMLYCCNQGI